MARWDDVEIVTLAQAKQHVRLGTSTSQDKDLRVKLRQAHGLVLDYIYRAAIEDEMLAWDDESSPAAVQAAILRQFAELSRFRGDDDDDSKVNPDDLSPRVKQLLKLYRDPVIA